MGLKAILENLDDVPEHLHEFYSEETQKDGSKKFVLDLEGIDDHPKVRGVITANKENIRKRDDYKAKLAEAEAKLAELPEDFDAEEFARLKAAAEADPDDPEKKKQTEKQLQSQREIYERKIAALEKKHADDLAARETEIKERDTYIDRSLVDAKLKDALLENGVNPDLIDGALATLKPSVKVHKDDDGNRKAIVETDMGELDVSAFVKDWAGTKGKAYLSKAEGPAPKGGDKMRPGAKTITRAEYDKLSPADQHKAMVTDGLTVVD